jgi:PAS domain S-box-containing protein
LLYSTASVILGSGYFLLIYLASRLFHGLRGAQVFLLALAAAILAAVAAQPLRDWLQGWLDRLFFRDQYDSGLMIQRLSQAAASTLDLGQLLAAILDDVTRTMRITWAALFLEQEGELRPMARRGLAADLDVRLGPDHPLLRRLAEHGAALLVDEVEQGLGGAELELLRQTGAHVLVPLCAGGSLVGLLVAGPRLSGQGYTQQDEQTLTTLANQTALAVAKARLYQAVQQELAERTRAEADLRRLKEFSEGIIQNLVTGILLQDARGVITFTNPAAAASLGYTPAELVGQPGTAIVPADQRPIAQAADERRRAGQADQYPLDMVRKDGERISVLVSGTPRFDAGSGRFVGTLAVFIDISERVRLEEQLRQAQKMEAVGQLAAGIAHDFNNLLMVINGFAEWMQWQLLADDPLQGPLNHIQAAGRRAAGLVNQLLGFARKQMIQPRVLDLNLLVEGMASQLKAVLGEPIHLETRLAPELWPVKIDPGQVEQILTQLAANARDAMPGGGRLTIETANLVLPHLTLHPSTGEDEEEDRGEYVRLAVGDTGYGMSPEVQAHLFEPFFTTKEVGQGSGLGLATVYGIVKQNRGDIQVSSEPGQGTTVRIYLPRAPVDPAGGSA